MEEQVRARLADLKAEFESGQARLREVERQEAYLRETLLRISGAIQVLEELTGRAAGAPAGAEVGVSNGVPA